MPWTLQSCQTRRQWIAALVAAASAFTMFPAAYAAQPVVEIIAFAHGSTFTLTLPRAP